MKGIKVQTGHMLQNWKCKQNSFDNPFQQQRELFFFPSSILFQLPIHVILTLESCFVPNVPLSCPLFEIRYLLSCPLFEICYLSSSPHLNCSIYDPPKWTTLITSTLIILFVNNKILYNGNKTQVAKILKLRTTIQMQDDIAPKENKKWRNSNFLLNPRWIDGLRFLLFLCVLHVYT